VTSATQDTIDLLDFSWNITFPTVLTVGTRTETEMIAGKLQSVISTWKAHACGMQFCDGQCRVSAILNRQRLISSRAVRVRVAQSV
jgi:hypothetical protein